MDDAEIAVKIGDEIPVVLTLAAVDPLPHHVARAMVASFPALGPLPWGETLPAAHPMTVVFVGRDVFLPGDCVVVGTVAGQAVRVRRFELWGKGVWTVTHQAPLDALGDILALVREGMAKLATKGIVPAGG